MLVDQKNANVFPLAGETLKCVLDLLLLCFRIYHEKVAPRIGRFSDMTHASKQQAGD